MSTKLRVGLVVPHIFMHEAILPKVVFAPGTLALDLANGLQALGADVTLFSPGPVATQATNITADLSYFERELAVRGDSYIDLLRKHPFTFVSLARQVQSELIAKAYELANQGKLDLIHIYTNEEDTALPFAALCHKPVIFTHHDPFNFLVKYKSVFPKYATLNWISMSYAQRKAMPSDTNWVGNIYHGQSDRALHPTPEPTNDYIAYVGRIIQPKGVHLAIQAVHRYNANAETPLPLKIAGKHYAGHAKDGYWQTRIVPELNAPDIAYVGFLDSPAKQQFYSNARALIVPSLFEEPFGMVSIEALACGTPVVALDSGAIGEVITDGKTGRIIPKVYDAAGKVDEAVTAERLAAAIATTGNIDRTVCRREYEARFTAQRMCQEHLAVYDKLIRSPDQS